MPFTLRVCRFCPWPGAARLPVVTFLLVVFLASAGMAQPAQPARFELVHDDGDLGFTIVSMKENGMSIIRQKQKSEGSKKTWEIILLDTALNQTWSTQIHLDNRLMLIGYEFVGQELYYLFRQDESIQSDLHLVRIYLFTHLVEEFDITPKLEFRLTHFIVVGSSAVLGGYVNRQSSVILFEMGPNRLKVVPGFFVDNTELLEVKANRNGTFNVLMVERGAREKKLLLLKTFDESGSLLLEDDMELDAYKTILAGTTSTLENDELFLAGTWGTGSKQASGVFSVLVDPFNKQPIHYYDFGELEHFLDYMPQKRVAKIKGKADRRRLAQKTPAYRADVHIVKIDENAKGYLLLAELYVPAINNNYHPYYNNPYYGNNQYYYPYGFSPVMSNRYNSPYPYYTPPYGSPNRTSDVSVLHSSLIVFDQQGKLRDDFGLSMDGVKLQALDQVSDFYAAEKFVQFYKKEKEIYVATNWQDGNSAEQDTLKLPLKSAYDVVRNESEDQGGVRYWFGPYAYAWGYESIKNKTEQLSDPVRYVYYVNKIRMD